MPGKKTELPPPLSEVVRDARLRAKIDALMDESMGLNDRIKQLAERRSAISAEVGAALRQLGVSRGSNASGFVTMFEQCRKSLSVKLLVANGVKSSVIAKSYTEGKRSKIVKIQRFGARDAEDE